MPDHEVTDAEATQVGCFFFPVMIAGPSFWFGWLLSGMQVPFENVLVGMGLVLIMWAAIVFAVTARD